MSTHALNFFDTLEYTKHLVKGGFSQKQAETLARENKEVFENNISSKEDIMRLEKAISDSKNETLRWVVGLLTAQTIFVLSAITFLFNIFR